MKAVSTSISHQQKPAGSRRVGYIFNRSIPLQAVTEFLAKRYVTILVALGAFILLLETIEHNISIDNDTILYDGKIILILLLLGTTGFLTKRLLAALVERSRAVQTLHLKHDLGMHLSASQDMPELARRLIQEIALIALPAKIELYLEEKDKKLFMRAADQDANHLPEQDQCLSGLDPLVCRHCMAQNPAGLRSFHACQQIEFFRPRPMVHGYCLPLVQGIQPIGVLHLNMPLELDLTSSQKEILGNVSGDISTSLFLAMSKKVREEELLNQKVNTLQLEIARDLHDTLGQNISYLRMKLDRLAEMDLRTKTYIGDEIQQMLSVANESYDLIRGTLAVLQTRSSTDLLRLFTRHAELVAERATFQFNITSHGEPKPLSSAALRQLFFIFREALSNIEKYARASQVCVELVWKEDCLALEISDDGDGFDLAQIPEGGHYGLKFMQQRAGQLNGSFSILSEMSAGTRIMVQVPCK